MDRRRYLKNSLVGAGLLLPAGFVALRESNRLPESRRSTNDLSAANETLNSFSGRIMGTTYSVKVGEHAELSQSHRVQLHNVLQQVDIAMSTWRADSEVSQFNQLTGNEWFSLSRSTYSVLRSAMDLSLSSAGAFDATVGPLVDAWGFGAGSEQNTGKTMESPESKIIADALAVVGYQNLTLNNERQSIQKLDAKTQIDLSGIAKGYAVDQLANSLTQAGFASFLVEVGGELRAKGVKPDGANWRVAIERPQSGVVDAFRVIELNNMAVATSGDYRHFFTQGSTHYSHAIDPRTGHPIKHELASVTVVAPKTMQADSFSTALMIMGPSAAIHYANEHSIAAQLILRSQSGLLTEQYSAEFEKHIA